MQHKKLYNLHKTAYFTFAFIYFENRQNSEGSNFDVAKKFFFVCEECVFFLFVTWYVLFKKKKVHHKMQREKLYDLQKEQFVLYMQLLLLRKSKILSDQFVTSTRMRTSFSSISSFYHTIAFFSKSQNTAKDAA
jgi:hypothetical protein